MVRFYVHNNEPFSASDVDANLARSISTRHMYTMNQNFVRFNRQRLEGLFVLIWSAKRIKRAVFSRENVVPGKQGTCFGVW